MVGQPIFPQRFGVDEILSVSAAFKRNKLWYAPPTDPEGFVNRAVVELGQYFSVPFVATTSSGTASIHTALGGLQIPAGSEVILPPITDAGTVLPIIFQNAIPVFADVDPESCNITAEHISNVLSEKTSAVIAVHLTGCPAEMEPIRKLCKANKISLIEDAAQALGAKYKGQYLGTIGDVGCFSLNDQKHVTCGEGGFVTVQDEDLYYRCHNFADKHYDRHKRGVRLDGTGLNYRMSDIDGAMVLAQLPKLKGIVERRRTLADMLNSKLASLKGVIPQKQPSGAEPSYFFYMFRLDEQAAGKKRDVVLEAIKAQGYSAYGGYGSKLLYQYKVFQNKDFFPGGVWPAELVSGKKYDYTTLTLPNAELYHSTAISLLMHQGFTETDIENVYSTVKTALGQ